MTSPSLEEARAVLDAQPFNALMGAVMEKYDAEGVGLSLEVRPEHRQQYGYVHGGVLCYLADNALTFAGAQTLGPAVLTAAVSLTYLRPADGQSLIARASVQAATSRTAVAQVEISAVKDGAEYVCAVGTGNTAARPR